MDRLKKNLIKNSSTLANQSHLLESLINFIPEPAFAIDAGGRVTHWNKAMATLTGRPAGEIVGKGNYEHSFSLTGERKPLIIDLVLEQDLPAAGYVEPAGSPFHLDEDNCLSGEIEILADDGTLKPTWIKVSTLTDTEGVITGALAYLKDLTTAKAYEARINQLNYRDFLTGLYNRSFFDDELKTIDQNQALPLTVIRAEINGLKLVNDTFGFHQGDNLIVRGAAAIRKACPGSATVCRWSGIGFTILMPGTDLEAGLRTCQAIKKACRECTKTPVPLSISFGAATKSDPKEDIRKIISDAEKMLQRDKTVVSKDLRGSIISSLQKLLNRKNRRDRRARFPH
jgi:diguanylate cyclase (GGDEF)-like protein